MLSCGDDRFRSTLYHAREWKEYPGGSSLLLLSVSDVVGVYEIDAQTLRLLKLCVGARTLLEHATNICAATACKEEAILCALRAFVEAGLLVPFQIPETDVGSLAQPGSIETVTIITADRPIALRRTLAGAITHIERHGRNTRVLIVDGSRSPKNQALNRRACDETAASRVQYVGSAQIDAFVSLLLKEGCDSRTLPWGLHGGRVGANRNVALLLTAGRSLMMVDDDIVWNTWSDSKRTGIAFGGHIDPRRTHFFKSREQAIAATTFEDLDLLRAHESVLGHWALEFCDRTADLSEACTHLLHTLKVGRRARVRATMPGLAGDAAIYCPYQWLFSDGHTRSELLRDPENLAMAISTREVQRIARQAVLTHDARCMAGCIGLANDEILPAFIPIGTNEDGVFGATLACSDLGALFGHLPIGIVHDSHRPSMRSGGVIASATQTRLSEVILLATRGYSNVVARQPSVENGLAKLGGKFRELSELNPSDFRAQLTDLLLAFRCAQLVHLEEVAALPNCPDHWRGAASVFKSELLYGMADEDFFIPAEFRSAAFSKEESWRRTQQFFDAWGSFLEDWPSVWNRCRQLYPLDMPRVL